MPSQSGLSTAAGAAMTWGCAPFGPIWASGVLPTAAGCGGGAGRVCAILSAASAVRPSLRWDENGSLVFPTMTSVGVVVRERRQRNRLALQIVLAVPTKLDLP